MQAYHVAIDSIHPSGEQQSVEVGLLHNPMVIVNGSVGHAWPLDTGSTDLFLSLK